MSRTEPNAQITDLIRRIELAFPSATDLSEAELFVGWDWDHLVRVVRGRLWKDLSPEQVRWICDGSYEFTERAFNYFLPAYLRASLIDPMEVSQSVSAAAWAFLPYSEKHQPHRTPEKLTIDQRAVLYDWLEWFIGSDRSDMEAGIAVIRERGDQDKRVFRDMFQKDIEKIRRYEAALKNLRDEFPATK